MKLDFDLLFLDFKEAYAEAPAQAVYALQALLLDPTACQARITFLRSLEERDRQRHDGHRPDHVPRDFAPEIRTILEIGIFPGLEQGRLELRRLADLTRDPDALAQIHEALMTDDKGLPPETKSKSAPAGFTALAARGDWSGLEAGLRPHLPYVLMHVGLPGNLADRLRDFLVRQARAGGSGDRRFRELIPGWLDSFARETGHTAPLRPLSEEDWARIIEWSAVRLVLEEQPGDEPAWARGFRRAARDSGVRSRRELATFALPADQAHTGSDLASFRRHLIVRTLEQTEQARRLFELN
jgi:hypothetical protein